MNDNKNWSINPEPSDYRSVIAPSSLKQSISSNVPVIDVEVSFGFKPAKPINLERFRRASEENAQTK